MITKITKLKNFGIFHDYSWTAGFPEFKKYNLIYGWNRSGKTTIARVFASCEKKCIYDKDKFKQYPENGEFEIKTDDGVIVNNTNVTTNILSIKVFNQDFIDEHISFNPAESCAPIFYQSKEDYESEKRLTQLKLDKITFGKTYEEAKKTKLAKEETKNTFLTGLGREIANILFDKNYNKKKVESNINTIGIDNYSGKILSDEDKKKYEAISKSTAGVVQNPLADYQFSFPFEGVIVNSFQMLFDEVNKLLSKNVISETLDRLKDDHSLNNWVKQGYDLHKAKNEKGKCLFCQKPLDNDFLNSLSRHFSKDYEDLQNTISYLRNDIIKIKKNEFALKNDDLYPDLKVNYETKAKELNECIGKINAWIDGVLKKLEEKHNNPLSVVINSKTPEDFLTSYNQIIEELNKIITDHNEKVINHDKEVTKARDKLELNSIAAALSEQDYKKMVNDYIEAARNEDVALKALNNNDSEILDLEKQTSNIGNAINEINKHLKEFFGREEIKLALDADKKGYTIERNGHPAINLSECEKTAIAFSYFVVKIGEGSFDKSKGVVFIDDPISSFDSNFIYHCFSMISTHFKEVGQLFISTHNFQLFNLTKDWFINKNNTTKRDNEKARAESKVGKPIPCEYFMVENFTESDIRKAKIVELDRTLRNYKSEYHFLFAKLKEFSDKPNTEYEDFYTIGNMARRLFDIFADFKIPTTGDQKSKMDVLLNNINVPDEKISKIDAGKAYKLVNEFSHNSDPTSTIEHKDKSESKEAIKVLLNIIKESDPKHYEILLKILHSKS
ncbi:MAG: hypothetical protein A2509_10705 [Candidatus Edwardsbacteria bacterium RIFOXYD12_FULL_50_11]|uniref:Protein CR006 P-loop domain-containing protein n=1 Tax=Candidatus Edwardsbacteria bacterium GWF2_54_11 TaxID=1817851 RepID=A0A1F5RJ91_9BACT|nr:MAG: hypothetical protein A2502_01485 [Candidatus Edwardsbacteria bacterium RifOxyC12_full_54_24]OGF08540.1 MAG: hypothetical protein A2273_06260 [Candidatus Edwardsbacteria bacterium RifOxyA12_full_54_48]OGF11396.1 MAG: hypothetical protein A3K15_03495 [Candidatus Edwardsbacteria bacterium GWE2_54_12]OGF14444.1 MAG: hypothetical protein A2024_10000 [Candidatus Edwardsbacteria bacterium GWF2_54_11]OGF16372.1 MAG: hypothetical protein A2509_10705 [Candidatus Edwardsbacteria bacterium RIFOXYD1